MIVLFPVCVEMISQVPHALSLYVLMIIRGKVTKSREQNKETCFFFLPRRRSFLEQSEKLRQLVGKDRKKVCNERRILEN